MSNLIRIKDGTIGEHLVFVSLAVLKEFAITGYIWAYIYS